MAEAVFDALGDATRRRIVEVLGAGERNTTEIVAAIQPANPISQPAVSQHLKILREAGLVDVRAAGTRRYYALVPAVLDVARAWLTTVGDPSRVFAQPLDALATEVARGKRAERTSNGPRQRSGVVIAEQSPRDGQSPKWGTGR